MKCIMMIYFTEVYCDTLYLEFRYYLDGNKH